MTNLVDLKRSLDNTNDTLKIARIEKARIMREIEVRRAQDAEATEAVFGKRRKNAKVI